MGLQLRHRLSALRDATNEVTDRSGFLVAEARCVPFRPIVAVASRRSGRSAAEEWEHIGRRIGYLRRHSLRRAGWVWVRHGTPDVFTIAEVLARDEYTIPRPARAALGEGDITVLDLGANIGVFGIRAIRDLAPAVITSVEADPFNARMLRRNAAECPATTTWDVIEAFAATADRGAVAFAAGGFAESRGGGTGDTRVPTLDAFGLMEDARLVKIDIEGAEWPILEDSRLADTPARALVLEYHQWNCPRPDDPASYCLELLGRAGFTTAITDPSARHFGTAWAWRD